MTITRRHNWFVRFITAQSTLNIMYPAGTLWNDIIKAATYLSKSLKSIQEMCRK